MLLVEGTTVSPPAAMEAPVAAPVAAAMAAVAGAATQVEEAVASAEVRKWFCSQSPSSIRSDRLHIVQVQPTVAAFSPQVASEATSTATTTTGEATASLGVWTGGATSRRRAEQASRPNGNHMLT